MDEQQQPTTAAAPPTVPTAPQEDHVRAALQKRTEQLQVQYGVLFVGSLLVLVYNWFGGRTPTSTILWAVLLGGAVVTRLYRSSLVNKLNAKNGGPIT